MIIGKSSPSTPLGTYRVDDTVTSKARDDTAWAALAEGLAGRRRVRVSRDGGKSYPARVEAPLTASRPTKPSAVMVYGYDGTARTIFFDLDTSRGGEPQVSKDYNWIIRWLESRSASWVEDISPSGGRHIYVPLEKSVPFTEARALVEAIATQCPSLDPSPHRSVASGCCRVPGSTHKSGGSQSLTQVLGEALEAVTTRNSPQIWSSLWNSTNAAREVITAAESAATNVDQDLSAGDGRSNGEMGPRTLKIAREGHWDPASYASASEARMAVIVAAARSGFTMTQVQERMHTGAWAGLAGLYARYTPTSRKKALTREWNKACNLVQNSSLTQSLRSVRKTDTSPTKSQGGAPDWLQSWYERRSLLESLLPRTRESQLLRMVLRAVEEAASKKGAPEISFGVRSLALATGMHPSTVAKHLNTISRMPSPLITRTKRGRGIEADTWALTSSTTQTMSGLRPRKVFSVRPAFRELGIPAALAYEVLEQSRGGGVSAAEVGRLARVSRSAVHEALETLQNWGLAVYKAGNGWQLGPRSLRAVALLLGVDAVVAVQAALYREQRVRWRCWLAGRVPEPVGLAGEGDGYPWWLFDPGPSVVT